MHIDSYGFGKIVIDGEVYTSDVIIYTDHVDASWWRKEGHYLEKADLKDIVEAQPEALVVGTGSLGVMKVPEETVHFLLSKGVEVHIEKSAEAVEVFNSLAGKKNVISAFHLTC